MFCVHLPKVSIAWLGNIEICVTLSSFFTRSGNQFSLLTSGINVDLFSSHSSSLLITITSWGLVDILAIDLNTVMVNINVFDLCLVTEFSC